MPQCNMPPVSVLSAVSCCRESADIRAPRRLANIPGEKERALIPPASPFRRQGGAQGLAGFLFHRRDVAVADEILPVRRWWQYRTGRNRDETITRPLCILVQISVNEFHPRPL
ncbi:unnamed protein product [Calypogeia fissa]